MKIIFLRLILAVLAAIMVSSCTKETVSVKTVTRTINFNLYTEKDFSNQEDNITFSILIRDGVKTLLDSTVATMKVKDVPNMANKLVYPKTIKATSGELRVGFKYAIEKVGYAWHYDTFAANELHKEMNFSFK